MPFWMIFPYKTTHAINQIETHLDGDLLLSISNYYVSFANNTLGHIAEDMIMNERNLTIKNFFSRHLIMIVTVPFLYIGF